MDELETLIKEADFFGGDYMDEVIDYEKEREEYMLQLPFGD